MEANTHITNGIDKDILVDVFFSNLPVGIILVNADGVLVDANAYMFKYFSKGTQDIKGLGFGNAFDCHYAKTGEFICGEGERCGYCDLRGIIEAVLEERVNISEQEVCHDISLNGRENSKWFSVHACPIINKDDVLALIAFSDISNRKASETALTKLGITDELTGLYNRRYIFETFKNVLDENSHNGSVLSLAMIDIDKFKEINDQYGHSVGDGVLKAFAKQIKRFTRDTDYIGRYGGEEFLILLKDADKSQAMVVLNRIAKEFEAMYRQVLGRSITFSGGLIQINQKDNISKSLAELIDKADRLLYRAKEKGRNRIET